MNNLSKYIIIIVIVFISCNDFYSAGNRTKGIDLEIKSNIRTSLIFRYLDSAQLKKDYALPQKYDFLFNGGDLEYNPKNNKIIYFSSPKEEAYVIGLFGYTLLTYIYDPSVNRNDFIYDRNLIDIETYNRAQQRIDSLYKKVLSLAIKDNLNDSLIYLNSKSPIYVNLEKIK